MVAMWRGLGRPAPLSLSLSCRAVYYTHQYTRVCCFSLDISLVVGVRD